MPKKKSGINLVLVQVRIHPDAMASIEEIALATRGRKEPPEIARDLLYRGLDAFNKDRLLADPLPEGGDTVRVLGPENHKTDDLDTRPGKDDPSDTTDRKIRRSKPR